MNTAIILPNVTFSMREHILAKDKTAMKYVNRTQIQAEINLLLRNIQKAGVNIVPPQKEVKSKTDLMDVYGWLYKECEKYNAEVLAERQRKAKQESSEQVTALNGHERKAARLKDASDRLQRYSDELKQREAGDTMGLDARGQKHRIASLKRKIARAEASLKKLQKIS